MFRSAALAISGHLCDKWQSLKREEASGMGSGIEKRRPVPLIRQIEMRGILSFLSEFGAPLRDLLLRASLPVQLAEDARGFASARSMLRFVGEAARHTATPDLCWRAVTATPVEEFGTWGAPVTRATTLRSAIHTFCAAYSRDVPFSELGLEFGEECA
jgi:hypothetical protein